MASTRKKRSFTDYLNNVIGEDGGLKTEITLTLTHLTILKIVGAATAVIIIGNVLKNSFPNKQITQTNNLLNQIKSKINP